MQSRSKGFLWLGVAGAVVLLLRRATSLLSSMKYLTVTPKIDGGVGNMKVSWSRLTLPLAIDFANRYDSEMRVAVTQIQVYYNGKQVGELQPTGNSAVVKRYSTTTLSGLKLDLPLTSLISTAGDMVTTAITGGNYQDIVSRLTIKVAGVLDNMIVFDTDVKIGESKKVDTSTGKAVSGLGLVASGKRTIRPLSEYESYLPSREQLKHRDLVVIPNGSVEDTVRFMKRVCTQYAGDTAELSKTLRRATLRDTLEAIWTFVYTHIDYVKDSPVREQVRRPLRTLYDQKGDCDCYATLIGSILTNLNVPFKFRIAEYANKGYFQHVYVVVPSEKGYYTLDPVLDEFNAEKKATNIKDF